MSGEIPHPSRLDPTHPFYREILASHDAAVERGEPTYLDPSTGLCVFTARALRDRGWCCESGCRHCPWAGGATTTG